MQNDFSITFFSPGKFPVSDLTYVILGAREGDKWIFVKNKERHGWELPAGHIEPGEEAMEAAHRELYEETGTTRADIIPIHDYSVTTGGRTRSGRLYFAKVLERGTRPESEIEEIRIESISPLPATFPEAHSSFLEKLEDYLMELERNR